MGKVKSADNYEGVTSKRIFIHLGFTFRFFFFFFFFFFMFMLLPVVPNDCDELIFVTSRAMFVIFAVCTLCDMYSS